MFTLNNILLNSFQKLSENTGNYTTALAAQSCRWQDIYLPREAIHEWTRYPKETFIFFAILFTEKTLLNFCYSIIYYAVAEELAFTFFPTSVRNNPYKQIPEATVNLWLPLFNKQPQTSPSLTVTDACSKKMQQKEGEKRRKEKRKDLASRALQRRLDLDVHSPVQSEVQRAQNCLPFPEVKPPL